MPVWKTPKHPLFLEKGIAEWYLFWWKRLEQTGSAQEFQDAHTQIFGSHSGADRRTREIARDYLNLVTYDNRQGNYATTNLWTEILETLDMPRPNNLAQLTANINTILNTDFTFIYPAIDTFFRTYTIRDTECGLIEKIEEVLHNLPTYDKESFLSKIEMEILLNYPPTDIQSWNTFITYIHELRIHGVCPHILESNVWRNSQMADFISTLSYDQDLKVIVLRNPNL